MSNAKIQSGMRYWSPAYFPKGIDALHALYAAQLIRLRAEQMNGQILIEAAKAVKDSKWKSFVFRHPCSDFSLDGYEWARGLVFKVLRGGGLVAGQAAIFFPYGRDAALQHGTTTDRSVVVHCNSVVTATELDLLVGVFCDDFRQQLELAAA